LLVTLILMFFMGTTNALFVGLSVPLSMFLAFVMLPTLDFSLNMIVLFAFLLALGIVVDDAIVVIENTHRLLHEHPSLTTAKAAKYAAGEVFIPVLAGTLTTVAPFVPLMFWPGIVGSFMFYLPVTLILTLGASLIVAFIMNPVFAVSFMQREEHLDRVEKPQMTRGFAIGMGVLLAIALAGYAAHSTFLGNLMVTIIVLCFLDKYVFVYMIAGFQRSILPRFQNGYGRLVEIVVSGSIWRQIGIMASLVLLFVGSIVAVGIRKPKVDFFPSGDPKFIYTYLRMPVGTRVEVTDSV
jgi:multidrug efflux pump